MKISKLITAKITFELKLANCHFYKIEKQSFLIPSTFQQKILCKIKKYSVLQFFPLPPQVFLLNRAHQLSHILLLKGQIHFRELQLRGHYIIDDQHILQKYSLAAPQANHRMY